MKVRVARKIVFDTDGREYTDSQTDKAFAVFDRKTALEKKTNRISKSILREHSHLLK